MTAVDESFDLATRYTREEGTVLLSGVQALVRLALDQRALDAAAGLRTGVFISGYEGSPLAGFDIALQSEAARMSAADVVHVSAVNEELAATSVAGSQSIPGTPTHDGVLGMWYGKAPGLDRAADAIRHGNYIGVARHGGVLVLVGDDPSAKSSSLPCASEMTLDALSLPVLYPGTVQEVLDFGLHGFAMSRFAGLWVGMKIVTDVADGFGTAEVGLDRVRATIPDLTVDGERWQPRHRPIPESVLGEKELFTGRTQAAIAYAAANGLNRIVPDDGPAQLGLVAAGKTYYDLRDALDRIGLDDAALRAKGVRLLHLGMPAPLEPQIVRRFAQGLREIVVVEEKRAFIETAVRNVLYGTADAPVVVGKVDESGAPLVPVDSELSPDRILDSLGPRLRQRLGLPASVPAPSPVGAKRLLPLAVARTPYFCSGCPHNRSTAIPEGSLVGAGIGCHAMVALSPEANRRGVSMTQMGGEGTQWIGQQPFTDVTHLFQNLGDGTFFHSGSLAVRACVSAGVDITFKLLYNGVVAMTGGQDPAGIIPVPQLTRWLEAEGVARVIVCTDDPGKYPRRARWGAHTTVWHRDRLDEAQRLLRDTPGVTALVYDQHCAADARRLRKRGQMVQPVRRVLINEEVCEGCGDCGRKSNCLSVQPVETEFGRKTRIDQSTCNVDYSCLDGDCPSFVTVVPKPVTRGRASFETPPADLPEPAHKAVVADVHRVYLAGIGGTGVVTVNQVLATAAVLDGLAVAGVDQTGLSQKAGPVVSHLKLSAGPAAGSSRVGAGQADLILGFDPLVAMDPKNLAVASPARTTAVVSTSRVPTGAMVSDPSVSFPRTDSVRAAVDEATRAGRNVYLDALAVAEELFGTHLAANVLLVGAAYQAGALPLSAASIERALELNGTAVAMNIAAFRHGRRFVIDGGRMPAHPDAGTIGDDAVPEVDDRVREALRDSVLNPDVRDLVERRATELVDYQNVALARGYIHDVEHVARVERSVAPGRTELSTAFARGLFRVLAYKDEYEVARLYLKPSFARALQHEFPQGAKVSYHLHPPMLRSLGWKKKIRFGSWFRSVFVVLRALRFLRGTPLDVFGYAGVRREERSLIKEYRAAVTAAVADLRPDSYDDTVALAASVESVNGYEHIKLDRLAAWREQRSTPSVQPPG
jgi:indolepyruvate ferredoxin oxidoreductase